ncbi:response regulator transcription factor [Flavihumibacter sp. R14]|nr:response regulator transcription factor [Flavihumibacter soli]
MLHCYIVDDEVPSIEIISDYINQTKNLRLLGSSTRPHDIIDIISGPVKPDITFLDIDMPAINGLELAGIINHYTSIIFISAYPEYGAEAFEKDAYDFLPKPISYARFMQAIVKIKNRIQVNQKGANRVPDEYFFIKGGRKGQLIKIYFYDVLYIESMENFVKVHTIKGKFVTYLTLKELEFKLDKENFIRVHKCFMINIDRLQSIEGNQIVMEDQKQLVLGGVFRNRLIEVLNTKMVISDRINPARF